MRANRRKPVSVSFWFQSTKCRGHGPLLQQFDTQVEHQCQQKAHVDHAFHAGHRPGLALLPLIASARIMPKTTINDRMLALMTGVDNCARCTDEAMKNSIGMENSVFVLDARPALPRAPAAAGSASPPAAAFSADAMTIF